MARPGVVSTSLPQSEDFEEPEFEELEEPEGEILEEESGDGEIDADEAEAAEQASIEAEARRSGWRPLAEYRGKAGGWVDAKTFLERGQNFLPFVQKERNELRGKVESLTSEVTGLRDELVQSRLEMQKYLKFARESDQRGYDRAVRELKAKQRAAAEAGDLATYDQVEAQVDEMEAARAEVMEEPVPAAQPQPNPAAKQPPQVAQWLKDNEGWFLSDRVLNSAMIAEHNAVLEESPGLDSLAQLELAKERVMARFPKKFGIEEAPAPPPQTPRRRPAAPMAPSGGSRPSNRQTTGIDAIQDPRERQMARDGFKRAQRSVPGITEEEYLAIYNDPHADVLDIREAGKRKRPNGQ